MYVGVEKPDFIYVTKHWGFSILEEYYCLSTF